MANHSFAPRCATKGIHVSLSEDLKMQLFYYIDQQISSGLEMDSLQIFEMSFKEINGRSAQSIVHRQKMPERICEHAIFGIDNPVELTVWILDEGIHAIMLLPEEY